MLKTIQYNTIQYYTIQYTYASFFCATIRSGGVIQLASTPRAGHHRRFNCRRSSRCGSSASTNQGWRKSLQSAEVSVGMREGGSSSPQFQKLLPHNYQSTGMTRINQEPTFSIQSERNRNKSENREGSANRASKQNNNYNKQCCFAETNFR